MGLAAVPLALTLGDPAGIGPDVTLLAYAARSREEIPSFLLVGDEGVLAVRAEALGLAIPIAKLSEPADAPTVFPDALPVLSIPVSGTVSAGQPTVAPTLDDGYLGARSPDSWSDDVSIDRVIDSMSAPVSVAGISVELAIGLGQESEPDRHRSGGSSFALAGGSSAGTPVPAGGGDVVGPQYPAT